MHAKESTCGAPSEQSAVAPRVAAERWGVAERWVAVGVRGGPGARTRLAGIALPPDRSVAPSGAPILPWPRKGVSPTTAPPAAFVLKEGHPSGRFTCEEAAGPPCRPLSQAGKGS